MHHNILLVFLIIYKIGDCLLVLFNNMLSVVNKHGKLFAVRWIIGVFLILFDISFAKFRQYLLLKIISYCFSIIVIP
jgi:hypothetical protein